MADLTARLTKLDMARVIVQALHNLPNLPPSEHRLVAKMVRKRTYAALEGQYKHAHKIMTDRVEGGGA